MRGEIKRVVFAWGTQFWLDICAFWGTPPPLAIESEPVVSDIPTLMVAGEYDPARLHGLAMLETA